MRLGWNLIQYNWCPFKKKKTPYKERDIGRVQCDDRDRNWNDAAASQGRPRADGHHQKLRESSLHVGEGVRLC